MATPTAGGLTVLDDDAALRILVARALGARKHARSLRTFPLCAPLPGQARLFERCVRQAERRLVLPARITLEWRAAGRDHEHGVTQATFDAGGRMLGELVIAINADLWPELLQETVYHELVHAHDLHDEALRWLDPVESEVRAIRWAAAMMRSA